MLTNTLKGGLVAAVLLAPFPLAAKEEAKSDDSWLERSNAIAYQLLDSQAKFAPEFAGQTGVDGYDEEIFDLGPDIDARQIAQTEANIAMLKAKLAEEKDPRVRQDLGIMIKSQEDGLHAARVNNERVLSYFSLPNLMFAGFRGLLDKQVPFERQKAALVRLKKYTGEADGYEPFVGQAIAYVSAQFDKGKIRPFIGQVQQDLERAPQFIDGLTSVFEATELEGWEEDLAILQDDLREFVAFVETEVLPRTRESARLPRELYELQLKQWGVDASPEELIEMGQVAFMTLRGELEALAPLVAAEKGYDVTDYRDVFEELKNEQVSGDELMAAYQEVMAELDRIIEEEGLATLPNEPARVRMATEAETAQQPAAHLDIPRMIGNTGEFPEFIVPLIKQNEDGTWPKSDYAFRSQMWTLSAHEARPGHEMQFTTMLRGGVSTARALFAFNSANVEGWALYAESIAKPYMPLDGQLLSLRARLLRAARIWLDPMLNLGMITREEAQRVLMEDVGSAEKNANNELDRYIFRIPGQATAYYYGFRKLLMLRSLVETRLKDDFDAQEFHDFILAQGLLPPELLRQSVMEDFVAPRLAAAEANGEANSGGSNSPAQ